MAKIKRPYLNLEADTFPKMLRSNFEKWGEKRPALRKKRYGIWMTYTWKDYYENAKYFALGLISLGFERGEKVAILGDNDPEWWFAALATQSVGGVQYGIFVDCLASEVQNFIVSGDATFIVVKDQEQCDKVLSRKDQMPKLKKIVFWDPQGMLTYDDPILMDFKEVQARGKEFESIHPNLFAESIDKGRADDIACLCFTSGTTGMPKAAMMSYKAICDWVFLTWEYFPWFEGDDYFSFLCPAWAVDQLLGIGASIMVGAVVNFPEEPETVREDGREIASQFHVSGARAWEDLFREIQVRIADADVVKRFAYKLFLPVGYKIADFHYLNKQPNLFWKALYKLGDWVIFRPLRDKCGLTRSRACLVAGAMLSPDLYRYWKAIGVPLYAYYALTETGYGSMEAPGQMRQGSAGKILKNRRVKISEEGEILLEVASTGFSGYYKNPGATAEMIRDGWFHTGDAGYIDDEGFLFFIDRISDLSALSNKSKFSPSNIEARLRFSRYIKNVMVVGIDREFVSALVDIDLENCGRWAEKHRIPYITRVDLSQKEEIYDLVKDEIERVNNTLSEYSRVKAFVNLHKEFDPDEAELTRTRKLKRATLEQKYAEIIEAIYSPGVNEVKIKAEVKYRDGRTGIVSTNIRIAVID
jgi:long-chain acyl-CoA synthetase